jgi:murein DD-endopeptidase MepM/ murein hydrolase activator NlpD
MFYTGKTLMLDHGFGLTSVYAHMSALLVNEGDLVEKGTPIGRVGKTGRVTGAHLHWGVTLNHIHLDPALIAGDMH